MAQATPETKNKIIKFVSELSGMVDNANAGKLANGLPSFILEGIEARLIKIVEQN